MKAARILVIEKNKILLGVVAAALEAEGHQVVATQDVFSGLRNIYETPQDVIIISDSLPMIKGDKAYRSVRQATYSPIIVLGSGDRAIEILDDGIDAYLPKPLIVEELVARVHSMLRRKRTQAIARELSTR